MIDLLPFLIKSSIALVIFYMYFYLFLRKSKCFQLNRIYLIFSSVFALVIPFLQFPRFSSSHNTDMIRIMLHDVNVVANYSLQSETIEAIFIRNIYIIGILVFISLFLFKLFGIYKVLHRSKFMGLYGI